ADQAGTVRVWDLSDPARSYTTWAHRDKIHSLEPLPDADGFLTLGRDHVAKIWKFADLQAFPQQRDDLVRTPTPAEGDRKTAATAAVRGHYRSGSSSTEALAVSVDEKWAATLGYDGEVVVWDLAQVRAVGGRDPAIGRLHGWW